MEQEAYQERQAAGSFSSHSMIEKFLNQVFNEIDVDRSGSLPSSPSRSNRSMQETCIVLPRSFSRSSSVRGATAVNPLSKPKRTSAGASRF